MLKLTLITAMYLKHDTSNVYQQGQGGGSWDWIGFEVDECDV